MSRNIFFFGYKCLLPYYSSYMSSNLKKKKKNYSKDEVYSLRVIVFVLKSFNLSDIFFNISFKEF